MEKIIIDAWEINKYALKEALRDPEDYHSYDSLLRLTLETIFPTSSSDTPDSTRIHMIDDGHYQGTLVFVIGSGGYQPSDYWYTMVEYGSCSGCDTLEYVRDLEDKERVEGLWTLCLHMIQNIKKMKGEY